MPIQVIVSQQGPLPIKATFNSVGDEPVYLEVNGSVWSASPNTMIGILVEVDGGCVGKALIFSNTASDSPYGRAVIFSASTWFRPAHYRAQPSYRYYHVGCQ